MLKERVAEGRTEAERTEPKSLAVEEAASLRRASEEAINGEFGSSKSERFLELGFMERRNWGFIEEETKRGEGERRF